MEEPIPLAITSALYPDCTGIVWKFCAIITDAENRAIAGIARENKFIIILLTFDLKIRKNYNTKKIFLNNI